MLYSVLSSPTHLTSFAILVYLSDLTILDPTDSTLEKGHDILSEGTRLEEEEEEEEINTHTHTRLYNKILMYLIREDVLNLTQFFIQCGCTEVIEEVEEEEKEEERKELLQLLQ